MTDLMTVREVMRLHKYGYSEIGYETSRQLDYAIAYDGPGWYSMNGAGYYEKGMFATYSRITVGIPGTKSVSDVVYADGIADGGEPYTDEELDLIARVK